MNRMTLFVTALSLALFVAAAEPARAVDVRDNHLKAAITMDIRYPSLGDEDIDANIHDWLEDILDDAIESVNSVAVMPDLDEFNSEIRVGYEVKQASERTITVIFDTYVYPARAAHGTTRVNTMSFDLRTKDMMFLDDYFRDPGKAVEIMAANALPLLNENLKKTMPDKFPDGLDADDGSWFKSGMEPEKDNFSNIVIEPDGVRVIFAQYQVLPYVFGLPEAFYPLETLAPAGPRYEYWGKTEPASK